MICGALVSSTGLHPAPVPLCRIAATLVDGYDNFLKEGIKMKTIRRLFLGVFVAGLLALPACGDDDGASAAAPAR